MINLAYEYKSILYQCAMISFLIVTLTKNMIVLRLGLISAYTFLILWEYKLTKKVTIDVLIWTLIFISLQLYFLHEENKTKNETRDPYDI